MNFSPFHGMVVSNSVPITVLQDCTDTYSNMSIKKLEAELSSLESSQERYLSEFDLHKNLVVDEVCVRLVLFKIVELSSKIQRKTVELMNLYEEEVKNIDDEIAFRQSEKTGRKGQKSNKSRQKKKKEHNPFLTDQKLSNENAIHSFYFRSQSDERCRHENEDLADIRASGFKFFNCVRVPQVWFKGDRDRLFSAVQQQRKYNNLNQLTKLYHALLNTEGKKIVSSITRRIDLLTKDLENDSVTSLRAINANEIDWDYISETYFHGRHSPDELKATWMLVATVTIRKQRWTQAEDILLRCLAHENNFQNWEHVNAQMPTFRSGFQCFTRYTCLFRQKSSTARRWNRKDVFGVKNIVLSAQNTPQFYRELVADDEVYLNDTKKIGAFSKREKFVVYNYLRRGYSYKAVASMLPNRTEKQIREHYHMSIKRRNVSVWARDEDSRLLEATKYLGKGNWRMISHFMDSRTPDQCRQRFGLIARSDCRGVEEYLNRRFEVTKVLHKKIQKFLSKKPIKRQLNKRVETYFFLQLDRKVQRKRQRDVADDVLKLLRFLNFDVSSMPRDDEFRNWLVNYPPSNIEYEEKYSKFFSRVFAKLRKDQKTWPTKVVNNMYTHIIYKSKVLPPNKTTIYGLHTFFENYRDYFEKNKDIDFRKLWKEQNAANSQKRYFMESKMLWYQTLKAIMYWPLKLKTIMPETLL